METWSFVIFLGGVELDPAVFPCIYLMTTGSLMKVESIAECSR